MHAWLLLVVMVGCSAAATVQYLTRADVAWHPDTGDLRSLSGIITFHRSTAHTMLCVLQALVYATMAEAAAHNDLLAIIAAFMLLAGAGVACFDLDEHPRTHFSFLVLYVASALAFANLHEHPPQPTLFILDALAVLFLAWLAHRRGAWDTVLTVLELAWLHTLCCFVLWLAFTAY